ncbi:MAG: 30S ribosomal protein S7 [Candidatus Omnitrophica bacterium CG_4_9_14_0_2_um_filter_42_8]|nr:MAG: 30S ribosomal protein S7 [Candidatus Omnitrophica bacterium CG22_combo_CG10-13_8_21_14_all_43_16]PJC47174.1 MAG: 30S ribosomal protein S7 [Candidatus Omnitrophica bacterium CG_4_9_14_0_2_um_filter_42_8]
MRRRRAEKRDVLPDPKFSNKLVTKFVNMLMEKGKKSTAERIVYSAMDIISEKTGNKNSVEVLQKAFDNSRPLLEVKPRRVGGATYQVPIEVKSDRGVSIAMRWIRDFARQKKGRPMYEKLAEEIVEAYKGQGSAMKKREDMHRMAEANKAFAHYRW